MKDKFIELFKEALDIDDRELNMSDEFRNYDEWDSLAYLSVIAMYDEEYDIQMEEAEFKKLHTVDDLFNATQK